VRLFLGAALGMGGLLMVNDDPVVAILEQELNRALPAIAAAKGQMEAIMGGPVGAEAILLALFIVFCGRQVMMLLHKAFDMWQEERRAAREDAREERRAGRPQRPAEAA
jgi:hypothetical protein